MSDIWSELAESVGITTDRLSAIAHLLANFPADGKPRDRDAQIDAHLLGFIEERTIEKPCPACGTKRPDYSYFKRTASGKLFSATIEKLRDTDGSPKGPDLQGLDGEAATAGAEGIAHKEAQS